MADNSDDPAMQNADVIQGGRCIRRNAQQLAALMAPRPPTEDCVGTRLVGGLT
jgi:hypothetical protein